MDVTFGTNVQKQQLFVGAMRTPTRETFAFNLTVIPSEKKWVLIQYTGAHSLHCMVQKYARVIGWPCLTKMKLNMDLS